jgi:hypothetical protein
MLLDEITVLPGGLVGARQRSVFTAVHTKRDTNQSFNAIFTSFGTGI